MHSKDYFILVKKILVLASFFLLITSFVLYRSGKVVLPFQSKSTNIEEAGFATLGNSNAIASDTLPVDKVIIPSSKSMILPPTPSLSLPDDTLPLLNEETIIPSSKSGRIFYPIDTLPSRPRPMIGGSKSAPVVLPEVLEKKPKLKKLKRQLKQEQQQQIQQ